jgi:hypothetical protein
MLRTLLLLALCSAIAGCAALADDLRRVEAAYSGARYQDAMVWLVSLEDSAPQMEEDQRARFFFMRGMTAYRLGDERGARHYLALAQEIAGPDARALRSEWRQVLTRTMGEVETQWLTTPGAPCMRSI